MEGIVPLTISCRVVSQRAINFSEFYDSSRQRYARFAAKEEESFVRSPVRSFARSPVRSFVRPSVRSFALGEEYVGSTYTGRCGAPASANRYALSSSLLFPFLVFLQPPVLTLPGTVRLCRGAISRSSVLHRSHSPVRQRFYLIALLCFIEQLLRSRAFVFFTVTTGNSCVCDF